MAVYFDTKIEPAYPGSNNYFIDWHSAGRILAVASYHSEHGGAVNLYCYLDDATHLSESVLHQTSAPASINWHPSKKILAIGWVNGNLTIWQEEGNRSTNINSIHSSVVSVLEWNPTGTRLLSADNNGVVVVWKVDPRGQIQQPPVHQHEVTEAIVQCVFKPSPPIDPDTDMTSLARAAVSGDESALDMFTWNKKTKLSSASTESLTCYLSGVSGGVYLVNESGECMQIFKADEPVKKLLFFEDKPILVVITSSFMLCQYDVYPDGSLLEISKVKLSGRPQEAEIIWAGKGVLATATGEKVIRMWDLDNGENFVLSLESQPAFAANENVICVAYCKTKEVLAGGTSLGNVALWWHHPVPQTDRELEWKLQAPAPLEGIIKSIRWGSHNLLAISTVHSAYILEEQALVSHYSGKVAAVQISPAQVWIELFSAGTFYQLKTDIQVKGVCCSKDNICMWNGKKVLVYDVSSDPCAIKICGTFASEAYSACINEQTLYLVEQRKVQVRTFQGTIKQTLMFSENEGDPLCLDTNGLYLVVGTSNSFIKVWDLSRREARLHVNPKSIKDLIPFYEDIASVKVNCAGNKVSIMLRTEAYTPVYILYIWDIESDSMHYFNFSSGRGDQDDFSETSSSDDFTNTERANCEAAKAVAGRYPVSHYWDALEPKLLVCEARLLPLETQPARQFSKLSLGQDSKKMKVLPQVESMVISLFATPENGIILQDSFPLSESFSSLLGVDVPHYYFVRKADSIKEEFSSDMTHEMSTSELMVSGGTTGQMMTHLAVRKVMRDFVGLENGDEASRTAMINFSYYLAIGNMDEAYKAIKLIKSESVWENMCRMCVKSRRIDVATVCLGNMGHARGAKALREAMQEPELDAAVAMLAIQLNMLDDAEQLYKNCYRYDLLNKFYQSRGMWDKALETADLYDRLHLRSTYYNYGKYLETKGDFSTAIVQYERSGTNKFEVPRMLVDENPAELEKYIAQSNDPYLRKWWAQYTESHGEMEVAMQFYEAAGDWLSLVRVYCYCGNIDKASEIANETGDRAACYHLARQFENQDKIKEAIHFFTRAHAYGNAIRICKEHALDDQLVNLALLSSPEDMIDAARYYEKKPSQKDKAVMLYHKAGYLTKAVDMAFKGNQTSALHMISGDIRDNVDPELISKMVTFFTENHQIDKAVDMLVKSKRYFDALDLCVGHNIQITEELAEQFTLEKENVDAATRNKLLEKIADCAMQQRSYHLATKKFTQAGNKVKAMRALLKSGDTEKIVFFANVSRQKEIYVMAANYLQTLDWRKEPELMKHIITFYTKGRALESLAGFYDACAQVEIDEYQNYEKALGALNEAYKCLSRTKMDNQAEHDEKMNAMKSKIDLVKRFVQARRSYDDNQTEGVKLFQVLLEEPGIEQAIRIGDIFGFLVEHYTRNEKYKMAYSCLEQMRNKIPNLNMSYYVNMKTVERIHQLLDIPLRKSVEDHGDDEYDEVEEQVEGDMNYGDV